MMIKVALLLLALAAPMISAGGTSCTKAKNKLTSKYDGTTKTCDCPVISKVLKERAQNPLHPSRGGDCNCEALGIIPGGDNSDLLACRIVPAPTCQDAVDIVEDEIKDLDISGCQTEICRMLLRELPPACGYSPYVPDYGVGGPYPIEEECLFGYGCDWDGHAYCNKRGDYGYGQWDPKEYECNNYNIDYNFGEDLYIKYGSVEDVLYGYGDQYGPLGNLCLQPYGGMDFLEYKYYEERCGVCEEPLVCEYGKPDYDAECGNYCNECEPLVELCGRDKLCFYGAEYAQPKWADASVTASGAGTETTVATVSYVLIAIAAALFLASIAFCAIGRRERKAAGVDNVQMNMA